MDNKELRFTLTIPTQETTPHPEFSEAERAQFVERAEVFSELLHSVVRVQFSPVFTLVSDLVKAARDREIQGLQIDLQSIEASCSDFDQYVTWTERTNITQKIAESLPEKSERNCPLEELPPRERLAILRQKQRRQSPPIAEFLVSSRNKRAFQRQQIHIMSWQPQNQIIYRRMPCHNRQYLQLKQQGEQG